MLKINGCFVIHKDLQSWHMKVAFDASMTFKTMEQLGSNDHDDTMLLSYYGRPGTLGLAELGGRVCL